MNVITLELQSALEVIFKRFACPDDDPRELARRTINAIEVAESHGEPIEFGFTYQTDGAQVSFMCDIGAHTELPTTCQK